MAVRSSLPATDIAHNRRFPPGVTWTLRVIGLALLIGGLLWLRRPLSTPPPAPQPPFDSTLTKLASGSVASMAAPLFSYSPGWRVSPDGADPAEPAEPWQQPSGTVEFTYQGHDLALNLMLGDYWGYFFVTVDGLPANRLANIAGNHNATDQPAGYRTFYTPDIDEVPPLTPPWIVVHKAADPGPHQVRIEVWRSWGQTPLRGVAVDALPPAPVARWPGVALIVLGVWVWSLTWPDLRRVPGMASLRNLVARLTQPVASPRRGEIVAGLGVLLIAVGMVTRIWWCAPAGLLLLGYAALRGPSLWCAALLLGLPFYFSQTVPILPGRATNLIDLGFLGGVAVAMGNWLAVPSRHPPVSSTRAWLPSRTLLWTAALASWALVAAVAADQQNVALREWRTVFLAGLLWAVALDACRSEMAPRVLRRLLFGWLAGAVIMAIIGLTQFAGDFMVIEAEGVRRVRGLYGSPNNLALYLERALFVPLAYGLFAQDRRGQAVALASAALIGGSLLLTFSKGALLLGIPAGLVMLWLGGLILLRQRGTSTRALWWLAAVAVLMGLALIPFLGTERFQRLLDLSDGTARTRLLLWRSSLSMALDHLWLGVGPDNFLYRLRSEYLLPAAWEEPNLNHPHQLFLDWWTRLGLPGLLLGLGFMGTLVVKTWRVWGRTLHLPDCAPIWLGVLGGIAAALAHGLIDLSYAVPDLMLIWVLWSALPEIATPVENTPPHSGPNVKQ